MLDTIITICSIYGLSFLLKESDGPWGIMAWMRNKLMTNKIVGVFFYKLFDCYFCLGCHVGYIIYCIYTPILQWHLNQFILWSLAGGAISYFFNIIIGYLNKLN